MTTLIANSADSLSSAIGELREAWGKHKFLRISFKAGRDRSLDQNAIGHVWYEQLARELREFDALGYKAFCKLHFGVPILRAEDEQFREFYDQAIKTSLSYEQKLDAMKFVPVTSLMTSDQKSRYLMEVQKHFASQVRLEFPEPAMQPVQPLRRVA
jgi:hypothetical protein